MKNRKNLFLVVLLLVVVAVATASTYAWLTDTESSGNLEYKVGDVEYSVESSLKNDKTVVPGELLGNFTITNSSNVLTNVRVKFDISVTKADSTSVIWKVGANEETDHILLKQQDGSNWQLVDNYYFYYGGEGSSTTTGDEDIAAVKQPTPLEDLFDTLTINGKLVGNIYSGATVKITITFQAKQAEYVDWDTIGSIDWEAGI